MSKNNSKVIIGRKWSNPEITIEIDKVGISISTELSSFITDVAEAMGNPTLLFSKEALRNKLEIAIKEVIEELKYATKGA